MTDGIGALMTIERFPALVVRFVGKFRNEDVPLLAALDEARLETTPVVLALRLRPCRFN